jgi:hypothetical protein
MELPLSGHIRRSVFTIHNGGGIDIDRGHRVTCTINMATTADGVFWADYVSLVAPPSYSKINHDDALSWDCLPQAFEFASMVCIDLTINIKYALVTQPERYSTKSWRFISTKYNGSQWHQQNLGIDSPCGGAFTKH